MLKLTRLMYDLNNINEKNQSQHFASQQLTNCCLLAAPPGLLHLSWKGKLLVSSPSVPSSTGYVVFSFPIPLTVSPGDNKGGDTVNKLKLVIILWLFTRIDYITLASACL